jgi:hypothetical protein
MPFRPEAEPTPLPNIRAAFDAITDFVEDRGVSKSNVRVATYRDFLDRLSSDNIENIEPEKATKLWREIHEIVFVISVFKENGIEPPPELLVRAFNGKPLEEYVHQEGRNFFLQLRAAIYFLRVGYTIALDTDCDVVAVRGRERIFVECKRLYSEENARDRVRKCYQQLEKRLQEADRKRRNRGLAWIDPSPAMQKHYFLYTAYSEAGAREAARMDLVCFWKRWIAKAYSGSEKRIFALILQMVWPSWIAGGGGIRTGFTSYLVPGHAKTSFFGILRARKLLDEIMSIEEA